jgi:hypothetical protein
VVQGVYQGLAAEALAFLAPDPAALLDAAGAVPQGADLGKDFFYEREAVFLAQFYYVIVGPGPDDLLVLKQPGDVQQDGDCRLFTIPLIGRSGKAA